MHEKNNTQQKDVDYIKMEVKPIADFFSFIADHRGQEQRWNNVQLPSWLKDGEFRLVSQVIC